MTAVALDPYAAREDHGSLRFLYRLNPLAKVLAPLPAMLGLLFARDPATPLVFAALCLLLLAVGARLSRRTGLALLLVLPLGVAVLTVSFALWTDPARVADTSLLWQVGDYRLHVGAFYVGLSTALRLAGLALLALVGGLTTTGPDLVRSLVQQLRVPYRIGYTALAAYRFVPRFAHELDVIRSAHRVRGVASGRGPVVAARRWIGYVVPLLASAIRHAERVALSMDSRAFGAHPTRTERHLVPFRARDTVFIALFWALTAAIILTVPGTVNSPIGVR